MDREKVIKGLEYTKAMITFNPSTGDDIEPRNLNEANKTTYDACVGAIALLKEQEAVEPRKKNDGKPQPWTCWWYVCGDCGQEIEYHDRFCRWCGRSVKWE